MRPELINKVNIFIFFILSLVLQGCQRNLTKAEQLSLLRNKQILVPMWGWDVEEMAPAAKSFGYEVVNAPHGNDLDKIEEEIKMWPRYGLKMIARPGLEVADPFDAEDVNAGIEKLNRLIKFYDQQADVVGIVISWGLFGEGGFPWDYKFSEKAIKAFNDYMGTPAAKEPVRPEVGKPGSLRWLKWMEFRAETLVNFRKKFVESAQNYTNKLVGTWSEVYPTEHYSLNMGCAPGADFLFYDLSFGDVTCNQRIAFGETHGDMQHYSSFEKWRSHELPLMAKAAGQGVIPIAFQFPMRRGYAVDFLKKTRFFIDRIEDEYSLRIGPDIRKLINPANRPKPPAEVAIVYQSFAAAGLPGGGEPDIPGSVKVLPFYENVSAKQIEGFLHQMGVSYRVIPYELLDEIDLGIYKTVIIPDPVYINDEIKANLKTAKNVLFCGEYMVAHRNAASQKGSYLEEEGFYAVTEMENTTLHYYKAPAGRLEAVDADNKFFKSIELPLNEFYPSDQMFRFEQMPEDFDPILKVGDNPVIITGCDDSEIYITNHLLNNAWHLQSDWLEEVLFGFFKNYLNYCGARVRVNTRQLVRVKENRFYGSYGLTGNIAWNATENDLRIEINNYGDVLIPSCGWVEID